MKVAVSIPDEIFAEAEDLAKRFKTSRSEIYSRALGTFIGLHAPHRLTLAMNEALDAVDEELNAFSAEAARQGLRRIDWQSLRPSSGGPIWETRSDRRRPTGDRCSSFM